MLSEIKKYKNSQRFRRTQFQSFKPTNSKYKMVFISVVLFLFKLIAVSAQDETIAK